MQLSLDMQLMMDRIKRNSPLMNIHALIHWEALRPKLHGLYKREQSGAGGQEPFDAILMLKAILLGQWHSLSDAKLEEALRVRLDFMLFCGLDLHASTPDETTLCRFRNRLVKADKLSTLLSAINADLMQKGIMVKEAQGAILDATIITAAARPRNSTIIDVEVNTRTGTSGEVTHITTSQSADPEARWVKKGKRAYFGYRSYCVVDSTDGFFRGIHSAPANEAETHHLATALEKLDYLPTRLHADKGFSSEVNRQVCKDKQIKSGIMHKAQRNKPLTKRQGLINKLISRVRYLVEQGFGTGKRLFGMGRASYFGVIKVNAQITMKAIGINLLKAANKVVLLQQRETLNTQVAS